MADPLSLAASSIAIVTVAAQVLDGAVKLSTFWHSIKDAPEEIADLIDEIEALGEVFSCWAANQAEQSTPKTVQDSVLRCLKRCQKELGSLAAVAERYEQDLKRRRTWASLKLGLRKEILTSHKASLERAKSTMMLAQQLQFSSSLQHISKGLMAVQSTPCLTSGEGSNLGGQHLLPDTTTGLSTSYRRPVRKRNDRNQFRIFIRTPAWLIGKVIDIQAVQAYSGWTFSLRTATIVTIDCSAMGAAVNGDLDTLRTLFQNRAASPLDVDEDGRSALHHAARNGELATCRFLIENGADPNSRDVHGATVVGHANSAATKWLELIAQERRDIQDLFRLLVESCDYEPFDDVKAFSDIVSGYAGDPEGLQIIQQHVFISHADLPLRERFEWAMKLDSWWVSGTTAEVLETAMGGRIEPAAYLLRNQRMSETLLFFIAQCLGCEHSLQRTTNLGGWRRLLKNAVSAGADLYTNAQSRHESRLPGADPMSEFIFYYVKDHGHIKSQGYNFTPIVRLWVKELKEAGVNLVSYGEQQRNKLKTGQWLCNWLVYVGTQRKGRSRILGSGRDLDWRIIDFEYGPDPEDWQVWATNPVDELAGDFWYMLENPWEQMPGGWDEWSGEDWHGLET